MVVRGDNLRYDGPRTRQYTPKSLTIFYNYTFVVPTILIIALVNVEKNMLHFVPKKCNNERKWRFVWLAFVLLRWVKLEQHSAHS